MRYAKFAFGRAASPSYSRLGSPGLNPGALDSLASKIAARLMAPGVSSPRLGRLNRPGFTPAALSDLASSIASRLARRLQPKAGGHHTESTFASSVAARLVRRSGPGVVASTIARGMADRIVEKLSQREKDGSTLVDRLVDELEKRLFQPRSDQKLPTHVESVEPGKT